VLCWW